MSEVKRYALKVVKMAFDYPVSAMRTAKSGEWVKHSDYAAVKAERDELAKVAVRYGIETPDGYEGSGRKAFLSCDRWIMLGHSPGCPVALAERITKEADDGR